MDTDRDDDDLTAEVASTAFSSVTGYIVDTHTAVTVLAITLTLEVGALVMFFMDRREVTETLDGSDLNVWVYLLTGIFVVGFLNCFAMYHFIAKAWPHAGSRQMSWLVSICAGLANILFFFALLYL